MHALLNSAENIHLILIQEPWYDKVGMVRKDDAREGVDSLGGVASSAWELHYPATPGDTKAKVMAYSRKWAWEDTNSPLFFMVTTRLDLCTHPCLMVLEIIHDSEKWYVINFYNDVRDGSALDALLQLDLDPLVPTLVTRDFNTHSCLWSLLTTAPSHWAWKVEEWAIWNLLTLANEKGVVTRQGAGNEPDMVLDLVWLNKAAVLKNSFHGLAIDWAGSLGSDHAMLRIMGDTYKPSKMPLQDHQNLGYVI